jgi:hypothetical protein
MLSGLELPLKPVRMANGVACSRYLQASFSVEIWHLT